jgi:hypothetical protein
LRKKSAAFSTPSRSAIAGTLGRPQLILLKCIASRGLSIWLNDMTKDSFGPDKTAQANVVGWQEFVESLRTLPDRMLAKLPDEQRKDPQIQQEVARLALESLASCAIDAIGGDGDFPAFLPTIGQLLNVGQPNADTIYRSARISPGGTYRLRGQRGSLNQVKIGQVVPRSAETGSGRAYLDVNTLKIDADGRFDVLISATKPEGYNGDWWELRPAAARLMLRMVSYDWANEQSPTFSIERIDRPMRRPRPSVADLEQRLRALPPSIDFMGLMFVDHVEQLRKEGYVNKFKEFDVSQIGGLVGQFYYETVYALTDREALIIESPVPDVCPYRSLILTNEIYETTDWYNNHSCLNGAQAVPDKDGILRFVVSPKDPGVKNWLDTAGYPTGVIQGRWTDCDSQPIPTIRKVPLADVVRLLPRDTAMVTLAERDQIIRERRAALLQRPHW